MHVLLYIGIFALTFIIMEGVTWLTHKFIMHGWLWYLHEDHHRPGGSFFERNDAFFIIFALPAFFGLLFGTIYHIYWMMAIGFGMMAYGYFLVHDVIIHQRFKWFSRSENSYIKAIRRAHKMHHKHLYKEDGESFGMLYVHRKYRQHEKKDKNVKNAQTA